MGTSIKTWFISDTHFSHTSILYFHPKRRESAGITMEELETDKNSAVLKHDEWLIELWNSTVKRTDVVYILGDFCLGNKERAERILQKLHGKKYLIRGNHDKSCSGLERYFEWVGDIKEAKFTHNQYEFIDANESFCVEMCHFPLVTWNRRIHGTVHLHGHCHGSLDEYNTEAQELRIDAGLDGKLADYNFISLEKLYKEYVDIRDKSKSPTFKDHTAFLMDKQGFRA